MRNEQSGRRTVARQLGRCLSGLASVALSTALLGFVAPVRAQTAVQPLRLVVPFGPGTSTDIVSRVVAEGLGKTMAQAVVVENRAGAGGNIGSAQVAKSTPDGTTLLMGTVGTHAINASLYKKLPYDPLKDFIPIALIGHTPTMLVVSAASPIKTLGELLAQARQPAGISFASAGNGTSGHLAGELLKARLGGQMLHVPYKEGGQAMTEVMSGQVQFMFYHPAAVVPQIRAGKLRALGVSSKRRSNAAPDVPTLAELGVSDFDLVAWFMLYAPAGTPADGVARLRDAAAKALADPDVSARLMAQGVERSALRADELVAFNQAEVGKWAEAVRRSGAQLD